MSPWPFERLLESLHLICNSNEVFVQTGVAKTALPCETSPYLSYDDALARMRAADIVISHAGNTVRLVQRLGKVPIAMAREAARGEMANDHQVVYLTHEGKYGRVIPLWNGADLPGLVQSHHQLEASLLAERSLSEVADGEKVKETLDRLCFKWLGRRAID